MINVAFCDLTHTGRVVSANYFPLGVSYIAAIAKKYLTDSINVELFKYPKNFSDYLFDNSPNIVCFSNYMWNSNLQLAYAKAIKDKNPNTITIFGGPNYSTDYEGQLDFLKKNTEIDFYLDGEAELAFVDFVEILEKYKFDINHIKNDQIKISNVQYVSNNELISGDLMPRISDVEETIPSPYLNGMMDSFFDETLMPLVQTSRGCPYSCTYCHDGIKYMNKTKRFSQERINAELSYISERVKVPSLFLADLNWGMFPDDIKTAEHIAELRKKTNWPQDVVTATAKMQKKNIIRITEILGDSFQVGASVQSTDELVLKNIKRPNPSNETIAKLAKDGVSKGSTTFTEIILGLPGDTIQAHFQSIKDMMDTGIQDIMTYQFILLPGTEAATNETRSLHGIEPNIRVMPMSFGRYSIYDKKVDIVEYNEVVTASNTLSSDDYVACRDFHLTMAIFNNGNIFDEFQGLVKVANISRFELLASIHQIVISDDHPLSDIYKRYRADEKLNFWKSEAELLKFIEKNNGVEKYLSGEYGENQIYKYRVEAFYYYFPDMIDTISKVLTKLIKRTEFYDETIDSYIEELKNLVLYKKTNLTNIEEKYSLKTQFDLVLIEENQYEIDPRKCKTKKVNKYDIGYEKIQKETINGFFMQYGKTLEGIGNLIHRHPMKLLFRKILV